MKPRAPINKKTFTLKKDDKLPKPIISKKRKDDSAKYLRKKQDKAEKDQIGGFLPLRPNIKSGDEKPRKGLRTKHEKGININPKASQIKCRNSSVKKAQPNHRKPESKVKKPLYTDEEVKAYVRSHRDDTGRQHGIVESVEHTDSLSSSKKRKIIKQMKFEKHNSDHAPYIRTCYALYDAVLRSIPKESRTELSNAVDRLVQHITPALEKKDRHRCTARAVQICLKNSEERQKSVLWNLLKDDIPFMAADKSFHHVVIKMYRYFDDKKKELIVKELQKKTDTFFCKFGAGIWEVVYCNQKTALKQHQLLVPLLVNGEVLVKYPQIYSLSKFSDTFTLFTEVEKQTTVERLLKMVQRFVDKELLDKAQVHRFIKCLSSVSSEEQSTTLMGQIAEGATHLISTKDGVEALVRLLGFATAKIRKTLIKALKGTIFSMAKNPINYAILIRLITTVDDTKLMTDTILKELQSNSIELSFDAYGHLVLLQLLQKNAETAKALPPYVKELLCLPSPTSLKAPDVRHNELRENVIKPLIQDYTGLPLLEGTSSNDKGRCLIEVMRDKHSSKIVTLLASINEGNNLREMIVKLIEASVDSLALVDDPVFQRTLSSVIKMTPVSLGDTEEKQFHDSLWDTLKPNLKEILTTRGVFVILEILKGFKTYSGGVPTEILNAIKKGLDSGDYGKRKLQGNNMKGLEILMREVAAAS